jgi:hypothetical protein
VAGAFLLLIGLVLLYLLRNLLVQVIVVLFGILGLIVAFIFILVGLALIVGRFWVGGRARRYLALDTAGLLEQLNAGSMALNSGQDTFH